MRQPDTDRACDQGRTSRRDRGAGRSRRGCPCPRRHQPAGGEGGGPSRVRARQAGRGAQHGDLLACVAREWHPGQYAGLWAPPCGFLAKVLQPNPHSSYRAAFARLNGPRAKLSSPAAKLPSVINLDGHRLGSVLHALGRALACQRGFNRSGRQARPWARFPRSRQPGGDNGREAAHGRQDGDRAHHTRQSINLPRR